MVVIDLAKPLLSDVGFVSSRLVVGQAQVQARSVGAGAVARALDPVLAARARFVELSAAQVEALVEVCRLARLPWLPRVLAASPSPELVGWTDDPGVLADAEVFAA